MPSTFPSGSSDAFVQDAAKQQQRAAFLKKIRLQALDLARIVALLCGEFSTGGLLDCNAIANAGSGIILDGNADEDVECVPAVAALAAR